MPQRKIPPGWSCLGWGSNMRLKINLSLNPLFHTSPLGQDGVPAKSRSPHPPLSSICRPLLPLRVPPSGKAYDVSRHLCCLCPLLGGGIVGSLPPPQITKHNTLLSSLHPPPLCWSCCHLARHPPITAITVFLLLFPTDKNSHWNKYFWREQMG